MENPDKDKYNGWHDDPNNWKWYVLYYNKEDKRIFPPKRIRGLGWTINFANPKSVFAFIILIGLVVAICRLYFGMTHITNR